MKRILLFGLLLTTVTFISNAQTTWDEYNYSTKGYKDVVEKGLNEKAGYKVQDVTEFTFGKGSDTERKVWLKALHRRSSGMIAAYIVVYRLRSDARQYYCIPSPSSSKEILDAYRKSLPSDEKSVTQLFVIAYTISMGLKW